MTRDEAIEIIHSVTYPETSGESGDRNFDRDQKWSAKIVDGLTALGVLKLDDGAKNANDLFHERMSDHYGLINRESFLRKLDAAGLKIVEK